jgi:lipoate synthase
MIRAQPSAERRNRLRQIAKDQNAAALAKAQQAVDQWKLETRTALVRQGLSDEGAHWLLENMPSPDELLPRVDVDQLVAELNTQSEQRERRTQELLARYERRDRELLSRADDD